MSLDRFIPFFTDSPDYVQGFECGIIWNMLTEGAPIHAMNIHTANAAQIVLMCVELGVSYRISEQDSTWSLLTANIEP